MTALLRTEGVSKAFGGVQALSDCSIEVAEGSITGLIGPNGSGKTTLFNVITGYERVDSGEVYLAGRPITNASPARVFTAGIGRTFQLTRVFSRLTVMENMIVAAQHAERGSGLLRNPFARAGGPATRRRAQELLEFTGIAGHAGALAETLSYGQRKLLELSYVLMADPAIVLLDEPAGGVNPTLIATIADRIRRAQRPRHHVPHRGAQHGFRDGAVRAGHGPGLRDRGGRAGHPKWSGPIPGYSTPISALRRTTMTSRSADGAHGQPWAARAGHPGRGGRLRRRRRAARGDPWRSPRAASPAWWAPTGRASPPCSAASCGLLQAPARPRHACAASGCPARARARCSTWAWCSCRRTTACSAR